MKQINIVLSIAGSDPSGGAGIQQDMRAIEACGCYAATVITALTSQNTMGVQSVLPVPTEVVGSQLHAVLDDLDVKAIKIGQIPTVDVAEIIATTLASYKHLPIVIDPVMISTSGHRLMSCDSMEKVVKTLFPLSTLITPNLPEYDALCILDYFHPSEYNLLIKGGHANGTEMVDTLMLRDGQTERFTAVKVQSTNLHGTGCALSSAIASFLAQGCDLKQAVERGKQYVHSAIKGGRTLGIGHGNGPVFMR